MNNQSGTKPIRKWSWAIALVVVLAVATVGCGLVQPGNPGTAGTLVSEQIACASSLPKG